MPMKRRNRGLGSAMSVPDMKADENEVRLGHTGGGASEMRSWRFGATSPFRKLIQVRPRTNDCRPSALEVSTQAKLVFPFAPLVGSPDRGGGLLPRGSSPWRGALGSRPLCNRELLTLVYVANPW